MAIERAVFTVDEAAQILGLSRNSAYEGVRSGNIPSVRIGRRIVVPKVALTAFLAGQQQADLKDRDRAE